jgi:hypothetical protein
MRSASFVAVVVLVTVLFIALVYVARGQAPVSTALASPTATATASATAASTPTTSTSAAAITPAPTVAKSSSPIPNVVYCGTLGKASDVPSGEGSGADTLASPKGDVIVRFAWGPSNKPPLGTYLCARFQPGAPIMGLVSVVAQGDPDYLPATIITASSAELLADALGDALEASDFTVLRGLMDPAGFFYQLYQTDGSQPITPDQAIDRLKRGTTDGKLHVTVQRRPIQPRGQFQPDGDRYIVSTWTQYDNRATQRVDLMLKNESGRWFWRGGLFGAPTQ